MSKEGKILGKLNLIDLLVIIVALTVVVGIFVRFSNSSSLGISQTSTYEYVVKVENIRIFTLKGLERKGDVFSEKNNVRIGEIVDVKSEIDKVDVVTYDGQRRLIERPDRYTAYVTVRAEGNVVNGKFYDLDKGEPAPGRENKINTRYVATQGDVISLKPVE